MHHLKLGIAAFLLALLPSSAFADQVILEDLIVEGSTCVGAACQSDEDWGAPTDSLHITGAGRVGIGTGSPSATAALDVQGTVRVDQLVELTGQIVTLEVKAGIVPQSAFVNGEAAVTFTTPYAGPYTVLLTPMSDHPRRTFKPAVLAQDASGFTLTRGGPLENLPEISGMTRPVGEY